MFSRQTGLFVLKKNISRTGSQKRKCTELSGYSVAYRKSSLEPLKQYYDKLKQNKSIYRLSSNITFILFQINLTWSKSSLKCNRNCYGNFVCCLYYNENSICCLSVLYTFQDHNAANRIWKTEAPSFFAVKTELLLKAETSLRSYLQWVSSCLNGSK